MRRRFDLILMDGSMPVLDGFDATRTIRQREAIAGSPRTPIIALTAHVFAEAAEAAAAAGMDGTLLKPFTLKQLAALLQAHVAAHRDTAEPVDRGGTATPRNPSNRNRSDHLLDLEVLGGLLALGDGAFLGRILGLYREQGPLALSPALCRRRRGPAAIARAAHSLKSMSANIGARVLVARLRAIEEAARNSVCAEPETVCDALDNLLGATIRGLEQRTRTHDAAGSADPPRQGQAASA